MPVILVVGPSHAGKSTVVNWLAKEPARFGLPFQLVGINLDEELGPGHRSDGAQAQRVIGLHSRMPGLVLADCGAGQLAFASDFREYVLSNIRACVAVWCDTNTFRTRHSSETVEREIANNYRRELQTIWDAARQLGQIVDTSIPFMPEASTARLARLIADIAQQHTWITA